MRPAVLPPRPIGRRPRGFTLLELAVVLATLGALIFAITYATQYVADERLQLAARKSLQLADRQLAQFAALNGRLPCPDIDRDGVEDCGGGDKGFLPYRTLGVAGSGYDAGGIPMRYGVYRRANGTETLDADLAVRADRFNPTNAHPNVPTAGAGIYDLDQEGTLDFCTALINGAAAGASTAHHYVRRTDGSNVNMAFSLALPGSGDRDNVNGPYDGLNGQSGPGFEAPDTQSSSSYDDMTLTRGFGDLLATLRCQVTQYSLDTMANAVAFEEEVRIFAESNADSALQGTIMNAVSTAIAIWQLIQAGIATAAASEVLGISTGLLASATAACAIPPFVACALIPVYAAAVASAGTGLTLSQVALGLAAAAVGLQATSTVMYALVLGRTGADDPPPAPPISQADVNAAQADYNAANLLAQQKESAATTAAATAAQYSPSVSTSVTAVNRDTIDAVIDQIDGLVPDQAGKLTDVLDGRYVQIAPGNPPTYLTVEVGALPAVDAYYQAAVASQLAQTSADGAQAAYDNNPSQANLDALNDALAALNDATTAEANALAAMDTALARARTAANELQYYDQMLRCKTSGVLTSAACVSALAAYQTRNGTAYTGTVATITDHARPSLIPPLASDPVIVTPGQGLCGASACVIATPVDDYLDNYVEWRDRQALSEAAANEAEQARNAADSAYDKWQSLVCGQQGVTYNPTTNACTTTPLGANDPSGNAQLDYCTPSSPDYDAQICALLGSGSTAPNRFSGALNILRLLDGKETAK